MARTRRQRRRNRRALERIQEREREAGSPLSSYAFIGRQLASWKRAAAAVGVIVGGAVVASILLGDILIPGGVAILLGYNSVKPVRTFALGPSTVSVYNHSIWTGRVKKLLATASRSNLDVDALVSVGDLPPVKLSSAERTELWTALAELGAAASKQSPTLAPPPQAGHRAA